MSHPTALEQIEPTVSEERAVRNNPAGAAAIIKRQQAEIERLRPMAESWQSYEAAQERKAELLTSNEQFESIWEDVLSYASAWSMVGGRFDNGQMLQEAEDQKAALRERLRKALQVETEAPRCHGSHNIRVQYGDGPQARFEIEGCPGCPDCIPSSSEKSNGEGASREAPSIEKQEPLT